MVASALLYIADAEEIEESFRDSRAAFMPSVYPDYSGTENTKEARSENSVTRPFSTDSGKSGSHHVNFVDGPPVTEAPVAPHSMGGRPVAFRSSTVTPASKVEEASLLQLPPRAGFDQGQQETSTTKKGYLSGEKSGINFERLLESDEAGGRKATETAVHSSLSYSGETAMERVDEDLLANTQTTTRHLRQQLSSFGFHSSAFVSMLHLLLTVSQLPSKLFTHITNRFSDILARAVLGGPKTRPKKWQNRLGSKVRKILSRKPAEKSFDSASGFAVPGEAVQVENGFSTLFLPASMERLMYKIRRFWKRLKNSEYLSVKSCACKQDADLWRQELQANSKAPPTTAEELGVLAERAENERNGRLELCVHPLWLELHAKVLVEQNFIEKQQLLRFFLRMGVKNVQLLQKAANQGILHVLSF